MEPRFPVSLSDISDSSNGTGDLSKSILPGMSTDFSNPFPAVKISVDLKKMSWWWYHIPPRNGEKVSWSGAA